MPPKKSGEYHRHHHLFILKPRSRSFDSNDVEDHFQRRIFTFFKSSSSILHRRQCHSHSMRKNWIDGQTECLESFISIRARRVERKILDERVSALDLSIFSSRLRPSFGRVLFLSNHHCDQFHVTMSPLNMQAKLVPADLLHNFVVFVDFDETEDEPSSPKDSEISSDSSFF